MRTRLYKLVGRLAEACIDWLVILTGRKVSKTEVLWLLSPTGRSDRIGAAYYADLAQQVEMHGQFYLHSVEDCLYKARWGMREHVALLVEHQLPVPPVNPNPTVTIQNERRCSVA